MEKEIKKALSFFPELAGTRIDFIFKRNIRNATMQAQPRISSLFRDKSKRVYKIKISRHLILNNKPRAIEDIPSDILVGWIAHELGHIVDYLDRSTLQMIGFGIRYMTSRAFLINAERRADVFAINHGFADAIIKTKKFILNKEGLSEEYKQRISRLYISPEEVRVIEQELATIL